MASGTAVYPSGANTFVKDHRATGEMVVNFSRNPSKFAVNKYIQLRQVDKESGYFLSLTVEEAGRLLNADLRDFVWHDGQERPMRNEGTESFKFTDYKTRRRDFGFNLGDKAANQAGWNIVGSHANIKAQQAMTARTQLVKTELDKIGDGSDGGETTHTSAVSSITGNTGNWAQSTTQRQDIKRSLNHAAQLILKDTLGAVEEDALQLVMSPELAKEISESQEIVDHVKHSDLALSQVRGDQMFANPNAKYGLPLSLYGFPVIIDTTVKVTSKKGATAVRSFVYDSGTAYMVARPGELVAPEGGPSWSTAMIFAYEEMTVETLRDDRNRRQEGHVVEDIAVVLTAPATGFKFTSAA